MKKTKNKSKRPNQNNTNNQIINRNSLKSKKINKNSNLIGDIENFYSNIVSNAICYNILIKLQRKKFQCKYFHFYYHYNYMVYSIS